MRNNVYFNIMNTNPTQRNENECLEILLKNEQEQTSISTIYIPSTSVIDTALFNDINNSVDNIIINAELIFRLKKSTD